MAPADLIDEKFSLRRFRGASGTGGRILPEWTVGDDSEDEQVMTVQRRQKARKLRSRGRSGQEKRQITPPPSNDTSDDSGIDSGVDSGEEGGDDGDDDEVSASPTVAPSRTSRSADRTSLISSTSPSATATSGPPGLGDTDSPPFLVKPALPEPTDADDSADLDSDDETSTFAPKATGTRSSSGIDRLPTQTTSEPLPASGTGSPDLPDTVDAATAAKQRHHRNVETALTVVGSVAGAVCIGVIIWALVRFFKRRRRDDSPGSSPSMPRPSRRARFMAHVPILKTRFADRSWFNIDDPYMNDQDARAFSRDDDLLAYLPEKPPAAAAENAPRLRLINLNDTGYYTTTTTTTTTMQAGDTNQAIASQNQPPYSPTASTLSSAFGNGTFMAPTEPHPPPAARHPEQDHLRPPSYRDTVYTESSEVSSVPRFRTVNSWVRHQAGRVRQQSPPPPMPDHGYGVRDDEEELKRVVVAPQGVGYAQ